MHICEYGCDQEGKYQFKNGKWCCSKFSSQCPAMCSINSNRNISKHSYKHTKESKEKLSKIRSEQIANGIHGGFKDIPWLKINNLKNEECSVRGNWEYWTAEYLNKNNINWSRNKFLNYIALDNICRTYNPDFYLNDLDLYIEVKGYFSKKDKEKIDCVLKQNNIKLLWINNKIIEQIKNNSIKFEDIPFYNSYLFNITEADKLKSIKKTYQYYCENCNSLIERTQKIRTKHIFCCEECSRKYKEKNSNTPSKESLLELFQNFTSIETIAKVYNVTGNAVRKWCKKYDIDFKQYIHNAKNLIDYNGKQYTIPELSKLLNISEKVLYYRYRTNKLDNLKKVEVKKYELNGEIHTLREWSEITNIPITTIRHRLDRGMSIKDSLKL